MDRRSRRPRTRTDLEDREAAGLWKAIALANKVGDESGKITLETILDIHKVMFEVAYPDIAGRFIENCII
jgi:hypothetical protein